MRGKKSYNIRNVEAHMSPFATTVPPSNETRIIQQNQNQNQNQNIKTMLLTKRMIFQTTQPQKPIINHQQQVEQQQINEYVNAKYGVSKYASNLVSGKMFRNQSLYN